MLEVEDLRKRYNGTTAVDGVSFAVEPGEVFGLLGPNGAGKSTTINVVARLLEADAGAVRIDGVPAANTDRYKRRLGYVPQEVSLAEKLTARENLRLIGGLYGLRGAALRARVAELLDRIDLADRADDRVATFSGGMKRRLNIAAAMLHQPAVLLMDEPTVGVDPQARVYIFEMIEQLAADGRAVLYTTHYMEEAQRLCDRIAIIDHGRILAIGTLDQLIAGIRVQHDLVLDAPQLTEERIGAIAEALGGPPWTLRDGAAHFNIGERAPSIARAAAAAESAGLTPTSIRLTQPTLENVFLELTGRALRE